MVDFKKKNNNKKSVTENKNVKESKKSGITLNASGITLQEKKKEKKEKHNLR